MDRTDRGKENLLDTAFSPEEREQLRAQFEAGSLDNVCRLLTDKGITTRPDVAEALEELTGQEPSPEVMAGVLQLSGSQERELPTLDDIDLGAPSRQESRNRLRLQVAARLVVNLLTKSRAQVSREQFGKMVAEMYRSLEILG